MADLIDGLSLLARLTGTSPEQVREVGERVKATLQARNACARHHFKTNNASLHPTRKLRCECCGYEATATEALLYEQGLRHGSEVRLG